MLDYILHPSLLFLCFRFFTKSLRFSLSLSKDAMAHIVNCVRPMTAPGLDVSSSALETFHASAAYQIVSFHPTRHQDISSSLIYTLSPPSIALSYDLPRLFRFPHLGPHIPNENRVASRTRLTKWKTTLEPRQHRLA